MNSDCNSQKRDTASTDAAPDSDFIGRGQSAVAVVSATARGTAPVADARAVGGGVARRLVTSSVRITVAIV